MKHDQDQKTKKLIAIKKTRSLIDKIAQMVEKDEYCIDIMQQNLAAIGLMRNCTKH
jgi:DNA-binding FrmR family transcriptional regulator